MHLVSMNQLLDTVLTYKQIKIMQLKLMKNQSIQIDEHLTVRINKKILNFSNYQMRIIITQTQRIQVMVNVY